MKKDDISRSSLAAWDKNLLLDVEHRCFWYLLGREDLLHSFLELSLSQKDNNIIPSRRKPRPSSKRSGRRFKIITDQQAVPFMFGRKASSKVKNDKILRWRLELPEYQYDIQYRPGKENLSADVLSRGYCFVCRPPSLEKIHTDLCQLGVTRLYNFKLKKFPYSVDEKKVCSQCSICAHLKSLHSSGHHHRISFVLRILLTGF